MNKFFISMAFFLKQRTDQAHDGSAIFRQFPKTYFEIENNSKDLFILGTHAQHSEFILSTEVAAHV